MKYLFRFNMNGCRQKKSNLIKLESIVFLNCNSEGTDEMEGLCLVMVDLDFSNLVSYSQSTHPRLNSAYRLHNLNVHFVHLNLVRKRNFNLMFVTTLSQLHVKNVIRHLLEVWFVSHQVVVSTTLGIYSRLILM